jgi:hypothetical protein
VLAAECGEVLSEFFQERRQIRKLEGPLSRGPSSGAAD